MVGLDLPYRIGCAGMEQEPTLHGLEQQLAVLEERVNTKQQEYKTDIARLAEDNAKRETRLIVTMIAIVALAVTVLRFTD